MRRRCVGPQRVEGRSGRDAAGVLLLAVALSSALRAESAPAETSAILREAPERIRAHRSAPLTVRVTDASGMPIPGAIVTVRQQRHEFLFGCNIFLFAHAGGPADEEAYRRRFAEIFNYATLPFYWKGYEPSKGKPLHEQREATARWCRSQGIVTKGHPLVWNHPAGVPAWLPRSAEEIRALSDARVTDCVTRFRGLIDIWDVVNEATDPLRFRGDNAMTEAYEKVGVLDWTRASFVAARKASPPATLIINDYRTDEPYAKLIEALVQEGKPLYDVIGIQSHMHDGAWSPEHTWQVCERYARFGVPIHFTETTLVSGPRTGPGESWGPTEPAREEVQARDAVKFYTTLFSHPAVEAITWWDFADRGAWQGAAAGFLRKDLTPKPVYERLRELIRGAWWTNETATTDAKGEATVRAFFGDHEVVGTKGILAGSATARHSRKEKEHRVDLKIEEKAPGG